VIPYFSVKNLFSERNNFDEIIDVRTPAEYAEDRLDSAVNIPVLSDSERVTVGSLYNRNSFEARKLGASLISKNIGEHINNYFINKPKHYKPLIYCWRGGQRSRSLAIILQETGFQPSLLLGGYKDYRKLVRNTLFDESDSSIFNRFNFIRVSGPTGSGKSLLLECLRDRGEQIIHLEQLARHKGSLLGQYPGERQPSQKLFETQLLEELETKFSSDKVIWIENESSKIGDIIIPLGLWRRMSSFERIQVNVSLEDRIEFIMNDYDYMCSEANLEQLLMILNSLEKWSGKKKVQVWRDLASERNYRELVNSLIVDHYDINYKKPVRNPVKTFDIPEGLLMKRAELLQSRVVNDIINFGRKTMSQDLDIQESVNHC